MNLEPIVLIPQLNMNEAQNRIVEVRNASINDEDPESQDNFTKQYSQEIEEARLDILREFSRTEHQDFSARGPLPKITNSAKINLKIKLCNVALIKEYDLSNLNAIIYATGKAISNQTGIKTKKKKSKHTNKPPKWKVKISKEIYALRAELTILDEISKGTAVKTRKARKVRNRNNVTDENSLLTAKETLKQKLKLKNVVGMINETVSTSRIRSLRPMRKNFTEKLGREPSTSRSPRSVNEEMTKLWNDIWGKEKDFNN